MGNLPVFDITTLMIIGGVEILLGPYILIRYQRTAAVILFSFLSLVIGCWVFTNGFQLLLPHESWAFDFMGRMTFVFAAFIFFLLNIYLYNFPFSTHRLTPRILLYYFFSPLIISVVLLGSNAFIIGFDVNTTYGNTIYGNAFWIYIAFMLLMYCASIVELVAKMKQVEGIHRRIIKLLLIGVLTSGTIGVVNQLIVPFLHGVRIFYSLGPASSIIWLLLLVFQIMRKG